MLKEICIAVLLSMFTVNTVSAKNSAGENFYAKLNLGHHIQRVGYTGGVSLGYFLSDAISIDTSLSLIYHKLDIVNSSDTVIMSGSANNNIVSGLINAYYHFDIDSLIYPYITFGGGVSSVKTDINKKWKITTIPSKNTEIITKDFELQSQNNKYFSYQVGFGMRFNTDDNYSFDVGYRFMNVHLSKFKDIQFKLNKKFMHAITMGVSIHF